MTCSTGITPDSPKTNSLIMVDKHLDTILETESDEFIKSSVENLVPTPSESEDASDGECVLPISTFSNPIFDINDDFTSSDDESFSGEKTSSPRPPGRANVENYIESFSTSPIPVEDSDSLIEEIDLFLIPDNSMPPGIKNDDYDSEGDILFL
ncbi:hypothetical protein Tco_0593786 [Tanacetum coccineum]